MGAENHGPLQMLVYVPQAEEYMDANSGWALWKVLVALNPVACLFLSDVYVYD